MKKYYYRYSNIQILLSTQYRFTIYILYIDLNVIFIIIKYYNLI